MPKLERLSPYQVYQLLPRTNCKLCGLPGCFAFAIALITREKRLQHCPLLESEPVCSSPSLLKLREFLGREETVEKNGLIINKDKCNGCGDCVVLCRQSFTTVYTHSRTVGIIPREEAERIPPVLRIVDGIVQVANWANCRRCEEPVVHCRICEDRCPFEALELVRPGGELEFGV